MNILPQNLKGKKIVDCYECDVNRLVLEFDDGTQIKLNFDGYHSVKAHRVEPKLSLTTKPT